MQKAVVALCFAAACSSLCTAQGKATGKAAGKAATPARSSSKVQQALSWLPADTEVVLVTNTPFQMPAYNQESSGQSQEIPIAELREQFEVLPLERFGAVGGLVQKYLKGQRVELAIEGSRHFRPPADHGESLYEGCAIAILADGSRLGSFASASEGIELKTEQLAGQKVMSFDEQVQEDVWTTLIAFPNPSTVIACTERSYLTEVLERMNGKAGPRALAATLAEWKYVDTSAPFWGLRHYDRSQAKLDPSSPFAGQTAVNLPDDQAIGVTFVFDPGKGKTATISYLSATKDIQKVEKDLLSMDVGPGAAQGLGVRYRELNPGVEASYNLTMRRPVGYFFLVLTGMFGQGVSH
jgi:hypothetical protein